MPIYILKCKPCETQWEVLLSMGSTEEPECPECGAKDSMRIPSWIGVEKVDDRPKKVGDEVKAFIEESKEIIEEYKEELERERRDY